MSELDVHDADVLKIADEIQNGMQACAISVVAQEAALSDIGPDTCFDRDAPFVEPKGFVIDPLTQPVFTPNEFDV